MSDLIDNTIIGSLDDLSNPLSNFAIAKMYEMENQTASALSYYLRAAEFSDDSSIEIAYISILKIAKILSDTGTRNHNASNSAFQAISLLPGRPEGYYLLSKIYRDMGMWQECYTFCGIGLALAPVPLLSMSADVGYYGHQCLFYEKYISAWYIGRKDESIQTLNHLAFNFPLDEERAAQVMADLEKFNK
jgi:tetratricopeptide (TPR) repeat protein